MFSFNLGQLAWISGGIDPIDRWQRNLEIVNLDLSLDRQDRALLKSNIIGQQSVAVEVLFDIIQLCQVTKNRLSYQLISIDLSNLKLNPNLPLLEIEPILIKAIQAWQEWENAGLADYCPSRFPIIQNSVQLSGITKSDLLSDLLPSIDGKRSLRSLAIHHRQNLLDFTKVLLPLLKSGSIDLSLSAQVQVDRTEATNRDRKIPDNISSQTTNCTGKLIACIDDSILVYKNLEKFLVDRGYRSYGVQDPLKIITTLIRNKPDLIFLDLLMPISNGYEICEQIRKTPSLKNIPVIILTAKDGLFDRMRAKLLGANEFLTKPASHTEVLRILNKYSE
ncbi:response regulator [Chamaesiphon sp. VAR_48_metabat_135_sub]|uniref:response regulator n=1 Tax=Chamaesiphon sp. VAR_48_metabat_135_sub TaxID=2964699 RepID=UPI00286C316B|nr:response regulator [Chamaesiphon sp. VAR_48_metabat_135_sub]